MCETLFTVYNEEKKKIMCVPVPTWCGKLDIDRHNFEVTISNVVFKMDVLASGMKSSGSNENYLVVKVKDVKKY